LAFNSTSNNIPNHKYSSQENSVAVMVAVLLVQDQGLNPKAKD